MNDRQPRTDHEPVICCSDHARKAVTVASRGPDLAALSDLRKEVVHDFLDPCFCDDLAEECVACSRIRGVLALIDKRLEAPRDTE